MAKQIAHAQYIKKSVRKIPNAFLLIYDLLKSHHFNGSIAFIF